MSVASVASRRYTTKAFDDSKKITQDKIDELKALLRLAPSSVNSQPWHFVLAASEEGKGRVAKAAAGNFSYNEAKISKASHVLVLCARTDMTEAHLQAVLEQEQADGRFRSDEARATQHVVRTSYVNLHRYTQKDLQHWMEKQVYLALGTLLLGAASLGLDATPMEGIDFGVLDSELGLREQGFTSVVVVSLGYHSDEDFNAALPKSRLTEEVVFTTI
ncbi:dihydropteridine reductase [Pokkaliibacter plantistimulans]|uniref:Dihydropteridine reductase n=1 Tax=Pokkaliibacter plantistimulans TaxID=1635171 RepID=A0ABX5M1L5_9GAMM|nr:oxygen-insensitive NAD(P)H nitroreductase [Pokkaliibacter plantistimulans]PXF32809.1 dihydropteridine reductase [Pokkaliibacter plantistimulans]